MSKRGKKFGSEKWNLYRFNQNDPCTLGGLDDT